MEPGVGWRPVPSVPRVPVGAALSLNSPLWMPCEWVGQSSPHAHSTPSYGAPELSVTANPPKCGDEGIEGASLKLSVEGYAVGGLEPRADFQSLAC